MRSELTKPGRIFAYSQSALITAITLVISLFIFIFCGYESAKSAILGSLIGIIPNLVFAYKAFQFAGATNSKKVVEAFFGGVKLKMVSMAFILGLTLKFIDIIPLPFFSMFILVMALPLITPFIINRQR